MITSIFKLIKRNKQPKVSVILPVYNEEKYLRQCMDSIINQSLKDIEIICVDDGSTDSSLSILREYEKTDKRIEVISVENENAGAARNKGIVVATGKYLYFPDSDDYCELTLLEDAYKEAEDKNADITIFKSRRLDIATGEITPCNFSLYLDKLPSKRPFSINDVDGNFFRFIMGWAWDKLFLREFIISNDLRFQEQRTTNDMYFTYLSLVKARAISTIDKQLYTQRINIPTSLSMTRYKSWNCFYFALTNLREGMKKEGLWDKYESNFIDYAMHSCVSNLKINKINTDLETIRRIIRDLGIENSSVQIFTCLDEYVEILGYMK